MTRWRIPLLLALLGGGVALAMRRPARRGRPLFGLGTSPKRIASESKTVEEYARRIEAWNASEAKPLSITVLAKAWAGGRQAPKVARLIREAREARMEGRERLWSRMARGLRGLRLTKTSPADVAYGNRSSVIKISARYAIIDDDDGRILATVKNEGAGGYRSIPKWIIETPGDWAGSREGWPKAIWPLPFRSLKEVKKWLETHENVVRDSGNR